MPTVERVKITTSVGYFAMAWVTLTLRTLVTITEYTAGYFNSPNDKVMITHLLGCLNYMYFDPYFWVVITHLFFQCMSSYSSILKAI